MIIATDKKEEEIKTMALRNETVVKFISDSDKIIKIIYVKNKLINIVIK